jgi:hypothetical protein
LFGIETGFHVQMSNHLHLVLRTRPDVVKRWSRASTQKPTPLTFTFEDLERAA